MSGRQHSAKLILIACAFLTGPARAAPDEPVRTQVQRVIDAMPEYNLPRALSTHPMLRIMPPKPRVVHLDEPLKSIHVDDPSRLNVIAYGPKSLVLWPRKPGMTRFSVIGGDGRLIMARSVIIAGPEQKYIRVQGGCEKQEKTCQAQSIYYCPDLCYPTRIAEDGK